MLERTIAEDQTNEFARLYSQWRLDLPQATAAPGLALKNRQILSVAEKILTRGRLTIASPSLETNLSNTFPTDVADVGLSQLMAPSWLRQANYDFWLDSEAERRFYSEFLSEVLGVEFYRCVLPQVELISLLSPASKADMSGRVDFLICIPTQQPMIVEIDGEKHADQQAVDTQRDFLLNQSGYETIRIPASSLQDHRDPRLDGLRARLSMCSARDASSSDWNLQKLKLSIKLAHQIQLTIINAIASGILDFPDDGALQISADLAETGYFDGPEALHILNAAVTDIWQLLRNLANLYGTQISKQDPVCYLAPSRIEPRKSLHVTLTNTISSRCPTAFVQDVSVPFHIANSAFSADGTVLDKPDADTLRYFLQYIFRKKTLWEGQLDTISRTLEGKDSIVLLPTGGGKSIAFQLASFLLPGPALVIDPIVSLMDDQIDNLAGFGIDRTIAITSQITDPEDKTRALNLLGQGEYLFAYIAPERLQTNDFRRSLRSLTVHTPISLVAIDEAHCVSEWGHDFRTAYLNVARICRMYCESNGHVPPIVALTGTASRAVLKDLQRELQILDFDAVITPKSFDRAELSFSVVRSHSQEKKARLTSYLGQKLPSLFGVPTATFFQSRGNDTFSGLVFCPHVNGSFGVVEQTDNVRRALRVSTDYYSGKAPKFVDGESWGDRKRSIARNFKQNRIAVLVCTKAFGMGIDKPNIRFTVHFGIPPSVESFYQEAGRAGRDRRQAHCCILVSSDDDVRTKKLLDPNTRPEEIVAILDSIPWEANDDITRALYFQKEAFPGIVTERDRIISFLHKLGDVSHRESKSIVFPQLERNDAEKCIHRLLSLGIVSDYTIDYGSNEFEIALSGANKGSVIAAYASYVEGYLGSRRESELKKAQSLESRPFVQFVEGMVELLLQFIYDVIERGRRRALSEMLLAATVSPSDHAIRERILRYLETTEHSKLLEEIIEDREAGLKVIRDAFDAFRSPNDAAEIRGQASRYLESYPDHPGLLMLRALAEAYSRDTDHDVVEQNFLASLSSALQNYGIQGDRFYRFLQWALGQLAKRNSITAERIQATLLRQNPDRVIARAMLKEADTIIAVQPALFLVDHLLKNTRAMLSK